MVTSFCSSTQELSFSFLISLCALAASSRSSGNLRDPLSITVSAITLVQATKAALKLLAYLSTAKGDIGDAII